MEKWLAKEVRSIKKEQESRPEEERKEEFLREDVAHEKVNRGS